MNIAVSVEKLIYLDADFISRLYEQEFHVSPTTLVTRTQGMEASIGVSLLSGGGKSSVSKSYALSTSEMLAKLSGRLSKYPDSVDGLEQQGHTSAYIWVDGFLGINTVKVTRTSRTFTIVGKLDSSIPRQSKEFVGEEAYLVIKQGEVQFALSSTDEYFVPGVAAFKGLSKFVISELSLPCRALLRIFAASTSFKQHIAVPLIIYEP